MAVSQQSALEVLTAAQEGISVKSLIDFRGLSEVSGAAQAVATAAVCMVAGIDEAVEADAEGLPPRTWEAARAVLAKPGHFINSLRRFPYAVDGGRLPSFNVTCARQCMEGIMRDQIEAEPMVAQQLFHWVVAAWDYCEHVPEAFSRSDVGLGVGREDLSSLGVPAVDSVTGFSGGRVASVGGAGVVQPPPVVPQVAPQAQSQAAAAPGGARRGAGQAVQSPEPTRRASAASSTGRSSMGRASIGSSSPSSSSYTARRSARSPGGGPAAIGGVLRQSQERLARAGVAPEPTRRAAANVHDSSMASANSASFRKSPGGYPRSARASGGSVQDQKQRMQQLLRETRELKAQEAQLKANMKREEDKQKKLEKREDEQETMEWRQELRAAMLEHEAQIKKEQTATDNTESREFQEHKRAVKGVNKETELQLIREDYTETKENSEWAVEAKKIAMAEWPKPIIEENLEKYRLMAEYNLEEQQREDEERKEVRAAKEQSEMDLMLLKARQERELALQALEYTRTQQGTAVPPGRHLAARPK